MSSNRQDFYTKFFKDGKDRAFIYMLKAMAGSLFNVNMLDLE
jgi:hypothetical protein